MKSLLMTMFMLLIGVSAHAHSVKEYGEGNAHFLKRAIELTSILESVSCDLEKFPKSIHSTEGKIECQTDTGEKVVVFFGHGYVPYGVFGMRLEFPHAVDQTRLEEFYKLVAMAGADYLDYITGYPTPTRWTGSWKGMDSRGALIPDYENPDWARIGVDMGASFLVKGKTVSFKFTWAAIY